MQMFMPSASKTSVFLLYLLELLVVKNEVKREKKHMEKNKGQ